MRRAPAASGAPRIACSAAARGARAAGRTPSCRRSGRLAVAPYLARDLDAELELRLFLLDGEVVAVVRAREAALRREAHVLERHVLRGGVDTALEMILALELRQLGADEAEHHFLALRHETQRLEAAGALGVVLEKEAIHVEPGEYPLGDEVGVGAAREPGALEVAATGVDAHRHVVRHLADRLVDRPGVHLGVLLWIVAELLEVFLHLGVAPHRDRRVVDLQIAATRL